ncbi:MAG TPA: metallophosphoesterase [Candidatus Baltobacteraceae bacterium]|jgi:hypothetical protein
MSVDGARVPRDPIVAAAGDIACPGSSETGTPKTCQMAATSDVIADAGMTVSAVLPLGDLQYPSGSYAEFITYYNATWGEYKSIEHPVPGNHEYYTPGASGYFRYFGLAAGDPHKGYYSYNLGAWHLIAINANCGDIGGCAAGSPEELWLKHDLTGRKGCMLAYWHQPRFSSGLHHDDLTYQVFWRDLHAAGADVVLNGHDHDYERFAPQTSTGALDQVRGIREFVAGTGGADHYPIKAIDRHSEVRDNAHFGVLFLTLHPQSYSWRFVSIDGMVRDAGSTACHLTG